VPQLARSFQRITSRSGAEDGFTMIELLIASALALVVAGAALTFMVFTFRQQNDISSRSVANDQAEAGLQQLTRDLREATTSVSVSTSGTTTSISFSIPTPGSDGTPESVSWTCPSTSATTIGTCTRTLAGISKAEITGVQSMAFTPYNNASPPVMLSLPVTSSTSVSAVTMTLTVQDSSYGLTAHGTSVTAVSGTSSHPIVLQASADLRNFS
jgi:prepilin-type N-terminal cleavage/methylation domain-containing protein